MSRGLVLALDGSTEVCSVALLGFCEENEGDARRWRVIAGRREDDGRAQARVLLRLVDNLLEETAHQLEDLRAVVVGSGPGTFTGVRITVATARALGLALAVPVLGVSTLAAGGGARPQPPAPRRFARRSRPRV